MWLAPRTIAWGGRRDARLIAQGGPGGTDARSDDERVGTEQRAHGLRLHGRAHDAVDAVALREHGEARGLVGDGGLDADLAERILVHAGEHGYRDQAGTVPAHGCRIFGAFATGGKHVPGPQTVNGEQISPGKGRRTGGPAHLMRNIVELEVEEHLEPTLFERADDLRAPRRKRASCRP